MKDAIQQAAEANPETTVSIYKAADSNPVIAKTLDLSKLPSLVYIQIKDENQREMAEKIQRELIAQGYLAPGIEKVEPRIMPTQTEIRYFHTGEDRSAEALVTLMGKMNVSAKRTFVRGYETARLNQYELWLASP